MRSQPTNPDESDLVERSRQGDQAAFGELVRLHQHGVYTLAVRLVGDRTLAADVAQAALIRAWRAIGKFRGDAKFSTWLYRITANVSWTLKKRASLRHTYQLETMISQPMADDRSDPEAAGEITALRARLTTALAELSKPQRTVVILKDVYGWSHQDIADALSISVTASKVRLHRAHLRLRELLKEER